VNDAVIILKIWFKLWKWKNHNVLYVMFIPVFIFRPLQCKLILFLFIH